MKTELEHFMDVFNDLEDLDDDAFATCGICGRKMWNRQEFACKACQKRLTKSLSYSGKQASPARYVVR
jgi:hypothetical protein